MIDLNRLSRTVVGGLLGGVLAGLGARLAMRLVALIGGLTPGFSLGGTLLIVLVFAAVGAVLSLPMYFARRWVRSGFSYGLLLMVVLVLAPFLLSEPQGEAALAPPLVGAALFAPLPVLYGLVLGASGMWLERRGTAQTARPVGIGWVALLGLGLLACLLNLGTYLGEFTPLPQAVIPLYRAAGVTTATFRQTQGLMALAVMAGYAGLCTLIFSKGWQERPARATAGVLLLFAGVLFSADGGLPMFKTLGLSAPPWLAALMPATAWCGLTLLLYLFPDGHWPARWAAPLFVLSSAWIAWVHLKPWPALAAGPNARSDGMHLLAYIVILGSGCLAQWARYRRADARARQQTRAVVAAFILAISCFVVLWAASLVVPGLRLRLPGLQPFFAFSGYLLPWLLLPVSIAEAVLRRGLWTAGGLATEPGSQPEVAPWPGRPAAAG
jgi:hypothetical protein